MGKPKLRQVSYYSGDPSIKTLLKDRIPIKSWSRGQENEIAEHIEINKEITFEGNFYVFKYDGAPTSSPITVGHFREGFSIKEALLMD